MAAVVRNKQMAVSRGALFQVITDFEKYPEFLPEVVGVQRESGGSSTSPLVTFELEIVKRFRYTLEFAILGQGEVKWQLRSSDFFKTNQGKWVLREIDSSTTDVQYEIEVEFGFLVPGWISRKLTEVSLPKMLDAFEERANKLKWR